VGSRTETAGIEIPPHILHRDMQLFDTSKQLIIIFLTLRTSDNLADTGEQHVHRPNRLAIVVHFHIKSNKKAEELSSKPILSLNVFVENVSKLKTHFEEIEDYRAQVAIEAKKEQENFDNARKSLASIKLLNKQQSDELELILSK
jgi:hypothetical protein